MKFLFKILVFYLFITAPMPVFSSVVSTAPRLSGEAPFVRFNRITSENGLSNNNVTGITQDDRGFMWFATFDGLNRYDGYDFKVFRHDPKDPGSLGNNQIRRLFKDRSGNLWIGTWGDGLDKYLPEKEKFIHYKKDPNNPGSLSHNSIWSISEDRSGMIWVGTRGGGLNRLDPDTGLFTHYRHNPNDPDSLTSDFINIIFEDRSGILWIGTEGGLNRLDPETNTFTHYVNDPAHPGSLSHNAVKSLYQDQSGILWVGTDRGLNRFDRKSDSFIRYMHDPADPTSLGHNQVDDITEDRAGYFWIATYGGGLNRLDRQTGEFTCYRHNAANPSSIGGDVLFGLYVDHSGRVWSGTYGGGISHFGYTAKKFTHYSHLVGDPHSLSSNKIRSLYEDRSGVLWVGTLNNGLNRLDRKTSSFTRYQYAPGDPGSLSNNRIRAIHEDHTGQLWIGTLGGGLNRFHHRSNTFTRYRHNPKDSRSLSTDKVCAIHEDQTGLLWIGTWVKGLDVLDRKTGIFKHYPHDSDNPASISHNAVVTFHEDRRGLLWIGTYGGGLNRFDRESGTFRRYQHNRDNPDSLSHDIVRDIHEDRTGNLWLATGGGLNRFNPENERFTAYTTADGLSNDIVHGILEDSLGNLWLSTNQGLSRFDPRTETFRNYDVGDGLQGNQFDTGAAVQGRDGAMYFGGSNGFNMFYPEQIADNPIIPPVIITGIQLANKPVPIGRDSILKKSIIETDQLTLSHREKVISFEFSALNYESSEKNQFKYKLEGFEDEWTLVDSRYRHATYTHLDPGTYTFKVTGSNNDGQWNPKGDSLKITIMQPWWGTWWFKILLAGLGGGLFFSGVNLRIRAINARRKELEIQVEERTIALSKLSRAQQMAHLGSWELDRINNDLRWSAEVYRIFEIDPGRVSASYQAFLDAIHPHDRKMVDNAYTNSIGDKTPCTIEHRLLMKDGRIKYVNEWCETVYDEEGTPLKSTGTIQDITSRKAAELALQEANNIINRSPAVAFLWKNEKGWPVEFVSENVTTLSGYNAEEFTSGQIAYTQIIHPDDLERVAQEVETASRDRDAFVHAPYRIVRKDGAVVWLDDRAFIRRDENGRVTHYEGLCLDITNRIQIETALKERQRHSEFEAEVGLLLTGSAPLSDTLQCCAEEIVERLDAAFARIWTLNHNEQILELKASAGLYTHLDGRHSRIPLGKYKIGCIAANKKAHLTNQVIGDPLVRDQEWARQEGMVAFAGYPLVVDDRVEGVMALFSQHPLTQSALETLGEIARAVALGITRQYAEDALKESEAKYRTLYEATDDAVMLLDGERFMECNPAALKIFGCNTIDELKTFHPADLSPAVQPDGQDSFELANQKITQAFTQGKVRFDWQHKRLDGREFTADVSLNVVDLRGRPVINVVIHDISRQKQFEDELIHAKEAAEAAAHVKSSFLANMSHEIRTPMNAVLGFLELVLEDRSLPEDHQKSLMTAHASATSLLRLINDILDVSKLESGKLTIEHRPFTLQRLIEQIHSTMDWAAWEKGIELELDIPSSLSGAFLGDPLRIRQIIINLVGNAIKFTQKGKVALWIRAAEPKDHVHFEVEDTGIGIPASRLKCIFDAFTQADASTTREFGGTGLGTTICRELVTLMNGRIWAESEEGKGSRFHVVIPLPATDQIPDENDLFVVPGRGIRKTSRTGFKILLAEDVEANVDLAKIRLENQGHIVRIARNGQEAVEAVLKEDIDVVLMDIHMPGMDGMAATERIREQETGRQIPIIAMTAAVMPKEKKKYLEAGMDGVVAKPIDFRKLFKILNEVVPEGIGSLWGPESENRPASSHIGIPAIEGVDIEKGLALWKDREAYLTALSKFTDSYKDAGQDLARFIDKRDLDRGYQLSHRLQGVAGNLAIQGISELCEQISAELKGGQQADRLNHLISLVSQALNTLVASVSGLKAHQKIEKKPQKEMDRAYLTKLLKKILAAFDRFNPKAVTPFTDELLNYLNPETVEPIIKPLNQYDFDRAKQETLLLAHTLEIELEEKNG